MPSLPTVLPALHVQAPTPSHSVVSLATAPPREPPSVTTYHVYRTGSMHVNYVLYTIPDSELATLCPAGTFFSGSQRSLARWHRRRHHGGAHEVIFDDPRSDPRRPAYFVHTPRICFHAPAPTLRFGGKGDPVVCLLEGAFF